MLLRGERGMKRHDLVGGARMHGCTYVYTDAAHLTKQHIQYCHTTKSQHAYSIELRLAGVT